MANALFSSGTLLKVGVRGKVELRMLSIESARGASPLFSFRS